MRPKQEPAESHTTHPKCASSNSVIHLKRTLISCDVGKCVCVYVYIQIWFIYIVRGINQIYTYVYIYRYIYVYVRICVHTYAHVYLFVKEGMCMCMCMYIYRHICIYIYVYIYMPPFEAAWTHLPRRLAPAAEPGANAAAGGCLGRRGARASADVLWAVEEPYINLEPL